MRNIPAKKGYVIPSFYNKFRLETTKKQGENGKNGKSSLYFRKQVKKDKNYVENSLESTIIKLYIIFGDFMEQYLNVYDLLKDEARWTKGSGARNKNNEAVSYDSEDAEKWCLLGAVQKIYGDTVVLRNIVIDKIFTEIKIGPVFFNDTSTHQELLELVQKLEI